jgi:ribosomal-protein-alanine N-acetyltransferase
MFTSPSESIIAMSQLTTSRLSLAPYQEDEAPLMHRLTSDLRVFFWLNAPMTLKQTQTVLEAKRAMFAEKQLGWWTVRKETGEPEIGYHFIPEFQNKGYATEAAAKLLDHGFCTLNLPRIVAVILPDNAPSQAVMKKLGLQYEKDMMKANLLHNYFAFERRDYLAQKA